VRRRVLRILGRPAVRYQGGFLLAVWLGWQVARNWSGAAHFVGTDGYVTAATAMLAIGLLGSTMGIDLSTLRAERRTVLLAVSVGVVAKAVVIAGGMYLVFGRRPEYLVVGVAVAQIDPLSVARMEHRRRLSDRTRDVLAAWSSFDDPVTVLLALYLTTFALRTDGGPNRHTAVADPTTLLRNVLLNVVLAVASWLVWHVVRDRPGGSADRWRPVAQVAALGAFAVVAVQFSLLLGLAVSGLYFRPRSLAWLSRAVSVAFFLAAFGIGLVLVTGISFKTGVVLGILAFASQIIVAVPLLWFSRNARTKADIGYLALGQQNGITAVTLALSLEPVLKGAVAVITPAILVVNALHATSNAALERKILVRQTERDSS
jgi:NhaP-type Na+/H+ or K+/H+ antiporter